ncbi:uncharacterized protein (TIGR03086 family) [Actinokineospora auranticolor]|uniref:Uncharacterized protein (TIGR03086 family) n=2 Tax=Actinokineospora auranticolor TaxID=155976 RepID=A0A2S6GVE3_9PSEU|nr:uncharacterized protein (TIGR03086 family) [Actinokineospora auranticolor]
MSRATESVVALARTVTPEQFDRSTPCPEWTVKDLINHLTLWSGVVAVRTANRLPAPGDGSEDEAVDRSATWPDGFIDGARAAARAWDAPGGLDGETAMMGDPRPARFFHDMLLAELVLHGWDLATATGHEFTVDDDVAELARASTAAMAEQGREWGVFGAEVAVPEDAPVLHRALAISGRDPR